MSWGWVAMWVAAIIYSASSGNSNNGNNSDYYPEMNFNTIEGPFADGGYSVGGWAVTASQYEIYKERGLGAIKDTLYPTYVNATNEPLDTPPPPLGLKDMNNRVELGGYYGSNLAYSFVEGNPILYYYPKAKDMFPLVTTTLPTTPQVSFSAGYENRSGYIGTSYWENRNIGLTGGTGYEKPVYNGNLLAPGYSYPDDFWKGES